LRERREKSSRRTEKEKSLLIERGKRGEVKFPTIQNMK
jgi:hypothetical protein